MVEIKIKYPRIFFKCQDIINRYRIQETIGQSIENQAHTWLFNWQRSCSGCFRTSTVRSATIELGGVAHQSRNKLGEGSNHDGCQVNPRVPATFHGLDLSRTTYPRYRWTCINCSRMPVEQIVFQEDLSICNRNHIGCNMSRNIPTPEFPMPAGLYRNRHPIHPKPWQKRSGGVRR